MGRVPRGGVVAVIEDLFIRKLVRTILARHGIQAVEYSVHNAVELLRSGSQQIDLVITNTPEHFLEFADVLPLVYLAAAPEQEIAVRFKRCRWVKKPFVAEDLVRAVRELLA